MDRNVFLSNLYHLASQPLYSFAFWAKVQKLLTTYDLFQNEGELWTGKTAQFVKSRAGEDKEAKQKRLRGKTDTRERLPTFKWLQCLQNGLRTAGLKFQDFVNEPYADEERDPLKLRLRCLVVATDQESLQLAGCNFLKHHSKVAMLHVYDPMHRRQNDSVLAMGESGTLRRCSMNLSLYNLKFGPWLKGGWYRVLQETGEQLRDMSPNDPLLLLFWPDIVKDRNFVLEDSQSGREDFLKTLRSQHFLTSKGPKASLSKFNALSEAHRLLDEHWSSQCFVMTATCLLQGWASYADQLWCPDDCGRPQGRRIDKGRSEGKRQSRPGKDVREGRELPAQHDQVHERPRGQVPEPIDSMRACARSRGGLAHACGNEGCEHHPAVLRVLVALGLAANR